MKDFAVSLLDIPLIPMPATLSSIVNGNADGTQPTHDNDVSLDTWNKRKALLSFEAPLSYLQRTILVRLKLIGESVTIDEFVREMLGNDPEPLSHAYMNRLITAFETLVDYGLLRRGYDGYPRYALYRKGWYKRMRYTRAEYFTLP